MGKRTIEIEITGISRDGKRKKKQELVYEEETIVKVNGEIHKFLCIPVDLEEMIAGNLKCRGIDPSLSRIKKVRKGEFEVNVPEELVKTPRKCNSRKKSTKNEVFNLVRALNENSLLYDKTGCAHVIGICGDKEIFVEDVSRHCAIDKVIGLAIKAGISFRNSCLITSCRQTALTIRKAVFCQIPIVISITAPTDLAVKEAIKYGITLIGFASSKGFNVYSHDWRIET